MFAGETVLDANAIGLDVLLDLGAQRLAAVDDGVPTTGCAHLLGREVRVRPRTVPVALDGLGVKTHVDVELLGDALEQPTRGPQLVAHREGVEDADLELPLAHHHFSVGTLDANARAHARQRVRFDDVASGHLGATDAAVVRTLGRREAHLGPAVGSTVLEERVLLLDAEHRLEARVLLGDLGERGSGVGDVWREVGVQDFTHHQDVLLTAQRVLALEHRHQHAVREVTRGLVGARTVKAPHRRLLAVGHDLGLAAQVPRRLGTVHPDVFSLIRQGRSFKMSSRDPRDLHNSARSSPHEPRFLLTPCETLPPKRHGVRH